MFPIYKYNDLDCSSHIIPIRFSFLSSAKMHCTSKRMPLVYMAALLLLLWSSVTVTVESVYSSCPAEHYAKGSQFHRNLKALYKTLIDEAGRTGFAASVKGAKKAERVWGRLQCRGDLSPADCAACSAEAVKDSRPNCNNTVGFSNQLDDCFFRYEKYNFLSRLDTTEEANVIPGSENEPNITDPHFSGNVSSLLLDLSRKSPGSPIKFAMGSSFVASSNVSIYGMEMCWRDMSRKDCKACLSKGVGEISSFFSRWPSVQVFLGSCTLRYEIYDFAKRY